MSALVDVATAITTAINAYVSFSLDFEAERSYADWADTLESLDELHVDVVPVPTVDAELETRSEATISVTVDIGIRKRFGANDQDSDGRIDIEAIDALVDLTQEIWLWLLQRNYRITDTQQAVWTESNIVTSFRRSDLRKSRQFTAIIRSQYDVQQALSMA